jgi:hypothetical protein
MARVWENVGSERNPRFEHVHDDRTRHRADRTIPMLTIATESPRFWHAQFICRECRAEIETRWLEGG